MTAAPQHTSPQHAYRLIVFDFDGTLVDSQFTIAGAMSDAFEAFDLSPPPRAEVRGVVGLHLEEAIARLLPDPCPVAPAEVVTAYRDAFYRLQSDARFSEPLFPGVAETLESLRHPEIFLAIATGKNRRGLTMGLERHGLTAAFHLLKTADDGPGKPHPAILEQAMEEAAVSPGETILVGDTTFDMEMAVNAGVDAIGVSWGYHERGRLIEAGARAVLETMSDLSPLLKSLEREPVGP